MATDDPRAEGAARVSCRVTASLLAQLRASYGDALLDRVVAASGEPRERLLDPEAFTTYEALDRLWRAGLSEVQRELEATRAQLVQSERLAAMGRLVSGVAHEINNPLTGIRADAEVLQARRDQPDLVAVGEEIAAGVDRCTALVRNMLAFGRQQPTSRQPVDLAVVVDRALMLQAYAIKMSEVELERPAAAGGPVVLGDPGQLQQVVHNLVENALVALEGTPPPRTLAIRIAPAGDGARVEVEDSGVGIPADDRQRIFEPFFTTRPAGEGTGLGLAICHGIVLSHGGSLEARDPASGRGALLRVLLPSSGGVRRSTERDIRRGVGVPRQAPPRPPAPRSVPAEPGADPGLCLLVVDDEDRIRTAISRLLSDYGHRVVSTASAAEARAAIETAVEPFDAILLDLRMPQESGTAFYGTLPPAIQKRVVFMTGALAFRSADEFLSRFWGRFVEKPFTYRELSKVLRRVADGS